MHLNVLLLLAAAVGAATELAIRVKGGFRLRDGPAALISLPAPSRSRSLGIAGIVAVFLASAVMGVFSLAAGLESVRCPAGNAGGHCDSVLGAGWLVLMPTQVLIFIAAMSATVYARSLGKLAIAVFLGLGGPVLALIAFSAVTAGAIPS